MASVFRLILISLTGFSLSLSVFSQDPEVLFSSPVKPELIIENNSSGIRITAGMGDLEILQAQRGDFKGYTLVSGGMDYSMVPGAPVLPVAGRAVETGSDWDWKMSVIHMDSLVVIIPDPYRDEILLPYVASSVKGAGNVVVDSAIYRNDEWYGGPVITLRNEGKLRGVQWGHLEYHPVQYNPVRGELKIYYDIEIQMDFQSGTPSEWSRINDKFRPYLSDLVITRPSRLKKILVDEPMTMVIVANEMFRDSLQPLIHWKQQKGFRILEHYVGTSETGLSTTIREWLKSVYLTPPSGYSSPTYLLLVGDIQQVPISPYQNQYTDLYYAEYDGNGDYLPELFYGRISARTVAEFVSQRDKILEYERYLFPDPSFLDRSILISGVDAEYSPTHANGQINYAHTYYFNEAHQIEPYIYLYPASASQDAEILDRIGNGASFVNYTGHGSVSGWENPTFAISDIEGLNNEHMYPVLVGNGCQTNNFVIDLSFSEAVTRAEGKGALAYIGCTNDSYWDEDFYWSVGVGPIVADPVFENTSTAYYDKVFHEHGEALSVWAPSLGEMVYAGNMSVQESSTLLKKYYWEIYQLMGDPSLVPWFSQPADASVEYPARLPSGTGQFTVVSSPYDYVAVSRNNTLLDARHADSQGFTVLYLPDTLSPGDLLLVVTGDRIKPRMDTIRLGSDNTSFLEMIELELSGESVLDDNEPSSGETFSLRMKLVNRGQQFFTGDTLRAKAEQGAVSIQLADLLLPAIPAGDTFTVEQAYNFTISPAAIDQEQIIVSFRAKNDTTNNLLYFKSRINAPALESGGITWSEWEGNFNGIIEPGEVYKFEWQISNKGHIVADQPEISYTGGEGYEWLTLKASTGFAAIMPGSSVTLSFLVDIAADVKDSLYSSSAFHCISGNYETTDSVRFQMIRPFENFQNGQFNLTGWQDNSLITWRADTSFAFNGKYAWRSGSIGNNAMSVLLYEFVSLEADSVSFWYKVSSESGYDFLKFYIDADEIASWSGSTNWKKYAFYLTEGSHSLAWIYEKDFSLSAGKDAAWIDEIILPKQVIERCDLMIDTVEVKEVKKEMNDTDILVTISNAGNTQVDDYILQCTFSEVDSVFIPLTSSLLPGQDMVCTLQSNLLFSEFGSYEVRFAVLTDCDRFPANNIYERIVEYSPFNDMVLSYANAYKGTDDSIWLNFHVWNMGNYPVKEFTYSVYFDQRLAKTLVYDQPLQPGDSAFINVAMVSTESLNTGEYIYSLEITKEDDIDLTNNYLEDSFYWTNTDNLNSTVSGEFTVWPNPTNGTVYLSLSGSGTERVRIKLTDLTGRILKEIPVERGERFLSFTINGAPGIYLVQMEGSPSAPVRIIYTGR